MNYKVRKKRQIKSMTKYGIVFGMFLIALSFISSVAGTLYTNDSQYKRLSKMDQINELQDQNSKLEVSLAKIQNSQNLKDSANALDMVDISHVRYVSIATDDSVAINIR